MAPLAVPICTRAAIHLIGRVVSLRRRAALASLPGSLRQRMANSCQPWRASSSAMMRLALCSLVSRWSSPAWLSPSFPAIRSSICSLNCSRPKCQPRRSGLRASSSMASSEKTMSSGTSWSSRNFTAWVRPSGRPPAQPLERRSHRREGERRRLWSLCNCFVTPSGQPKAAGIPLSGQGWLRASVPLQPHT